MNIKKFFAILILFVMPICLLSGCTSNIASRVENTEATSTVVPTKVPATVGTFVIINSKQFGSTEIDQYIVYDPETMVMYTILHDSGNEEAGLAITPMYTQAGRPRIYFP